MGYYSDCIGDTTKARLNKHRTKGDTYNSLVNKMLDFYELHNSIPSTDLTKLLTIEELQKYRNLYHDFQNCLYVTSPRETPPSMQHTLNWDRIHNEQKAYFDFKAELEKKYGKEIKGDI